MKYNKQVTYTVSGKKSIGSFIFYHRFVCFFKQLSLPTFLERFLARYPYGRKYIHVMGLKLIFDCTEKTQAHFKRWLFNFLSLQMSDIVIVFNCAGFKAPWQGLFIVLIIMVIIPAMNAHLFLRYEVPRDTYVLPSTCQ